MEQAARLSQKIISKFHWVRYDLIFVQQDCEMAVVWVSQLLREYMETSIDEGFTIKLACISDLKYVRYSFGKNMAGITDFLKSIF